MTTQSPDVLQEAALREALERIAALEKSENHNHNGADLRLNQAISIAEAALSTLPQQAATDVGEVLMVPEGWQLVPVEIAPAMLDATCCDEGDDAEMRLTWKELLYAAPNPPIPSTPTAQPPAAETREALEWYAEQAEGCRKLGYAGDPFRNALDADGGKRAREALAALTQPEPTAQQGGEE